jgi:tetratricopeptide (TPR) repeat protein
MDTQVPTGARDRQAIWPARSGAVPPLADGFSARPETAPGLMSALGPGATVVLAPRPPAAAGPRNWSGASGKTQLAVLSAESLCQSGAVDLLVWVPAGSRASILSGYVEAAIATMGCGPESDAESVAARFVSWLGQTSRPWLVVLDDLSDAAVLKGLWPAGPAGRTLITTASSSALVGIRAASVQPVGAFSAREALTYLIGRLTADPDQRLGALDLVADLACEPLALAQASAVIASSALACRDYRSYFGRRREELAQASRADPAAAAVTWTISLEQADRLSPGGATQPCLALAAVLDGRAIPGEVFTSAAACAYLASYGTGGQPSPEHARDALLNLERAGLLNSDPRCAPPIFRMNAVVQAAVREAMPADMLQRAARAAADALLEAWPPEERRGWHADALRSCAASLQQVAGSVLWADGCHPLLLRAGRSLDNARLTGPAVGYWTGLAAASDQMLGPGHPNGMLVGEHLARAQLVAGQAQQAVTWYQRVLADRAPGHARGQGAGSLSDRVSLGHALVAANQVGDAITVLAGALADCERQRGVDHLDTLALRDELAAAYRAAGQSADATRLYRRTLAARERIQGRRHPDAMTTREQRAAAYLADDRMKDALASYKRALADRERTQGLDHPSTLSVRRNLAAAYHSAGRMAMAMQLYEQTCAECERVLGAEHPDTLACRASLAYVYYAVGRLTDAITLLRDTVASCERVLGAGDPLTQTARQSLANIAGG